MGRKMKSTKSGKFINPTDQARKEARKRELRKNKKQRLLVRTAVIKGKDPYQIITDMERLDKMEYDFHNPPPLNEKVLKDKRRKLKETWDRVIRLYSKDDKDRYLELKRMESDYEAKRNELIKQFDAIRSAQDVSIEDIPLPSLPIDSGPPTETVTHSILKSTKTKKQPPGCPPGLPPNLKEFEIDDEDDDDEEDDKMEGLIAKKRIKFSDEVAESGKEKDSNLTDFLKEIEQLSGDKDKKENNLNTINKERDSEKAKEFGAATVNNQEKEMSTTSSGSSALLPPQSHLFQPLVPNPAPSVLLPPPSISGHSLPPSMPGIRPNVPGPFVPGRLPMHPPRLPIAPHRPPLPFQSNIASQSPAPSSSILNYVRKPEDNRSKHQRHGSTIEAKPQLRNLSADSTKFMPLSLRVKRDEKQAVVKRPTKTAVGYGMVHSAGSDLYSNPSIRSHVTSSTVGSSSSSAAKPKNNSKDNAYEQFMKEMQGFI